MKLSRKIAQWMSIVSLLISEAALTAGVIALTLKQYAIATGLVLLTLWQVWDYKQWQKRK